MKVREAFEYDVGYQFKYAKSAARLHSPQRRLIERALRTLSDYIEDELGVDVVIREFMIKRWLVDFTVAVQKSLSETDSRFKEGWDSLQALIDSCRNGETVPQDEEQQSLKELGEIWTTYLWKHLDDMHASSTSAQVCLVSDGQHDLDMAQYVIGKRVWEDAWVEQYRGNALFHLETKLQLNVHALGLADDITSSMSRIIPIVQSSGTGKSRLAEE